MGKMCGWHHLHSFRFGIHLGATYSFYEIWIPPYQEPALGSGAVHASNFLALPAPKGVMVFWCVEIFQGTHDGNTTSTFFFGFVHEESEAERIFTDGGSFLLHFSEITLVDITELVEEMTSGGRFTRIDVSADEDRHMFLSFFCCSSHCVWWLEVILHVLCVYTTA